MKRSLTIFDPILGILLSLLGIVFGVAGSIVCGITGKLEIWFPLVFALPALHALIYSVINLVFTIVKKDLPIKIANIVFHGVNIVANILVSIATFVVAMFASIFIAIVGGIAESATEDKEAAQAATDAQIKAFMNNFTPISLAFIVMAFVSIACIAFAIVGFKNKRFGKVSGELTRFFYLFGGVSWIAFALIYATSNGMAECILTFFGAALSFASMSTLGATMVALNEEKRGKFDFVERLAGLLVAFWCATMLFVPQYLSYGTVAGVDTYFVTKLDYLIGILTLIAVGLLLAAKYTSGKKVNLFFLTPVSLILLSAGFTLSLIFSEFNSPLMPAFYITSYSLAFIGALVLTAFQVLNFVSYKKEHKGA